MIALRTFRPLRIANVGLCVAIVLAAGAGALGAASAEDGEADEAEEPTAVDEPPSHAESIEVRTEGAAVQDAQLDLEVLDTGRAPNLGVALGTVAGVSGVRRSQNAYEPVVRGQGWERVQTQVNGMPLYGACPARMDPPSCCVTPSAAFGVTVVKGLASVTLGPAGTGGRVNITTDFDRGAGAGTDLDPWLRTSYNSANSGATGAAGVNGGTGRIDYAVGIELLEQGDYESAGGTTVPASQKDKGASLSFGHRPGEDHRWSVSGLVQNGEDIAFPSLPMDTEYVDTTIVTGGYRYEPSRTATGLSAIEVSLGLSGVDHLMSNRKRTNRPMMEAETRSEASTRMAGVVTRWALSSSAVLSAGLDANAMGRDALRSRFATARDRTFLDHLWPDVSQDDLGLFGEFSHAPGTGWRIRYGVRYDDVRSDAAAADDPALGGGTIREAYVRFYGPEAARTSRDEGLLTGNVTFSKALGRSVTLEGGAGVVSRAAGMTERYFAFALSPLGFVVGNPTLDAERKREVSFGASFGAKRWSGSVSGYYYSIRDYILPVVLGEQDVNGDGRDDLIRGFENTDATLRGVDLSLLIRPGERWNVPVSLAAVRGDDDTRGVPLPEIPPYEARAAGRFLFLGKVPGWVEAGGRFVAEADRIDPGFPENETPAFQVWHVRARVDVTRHLAIEAGVENLFDEDYTEHLTREAAGNVPGLEPGQEIPEPGRFVTVALRFTL